MAFANHIEFGGLSIADLHEQFDQSDPNIEQHFSNQDLANMSEYEKVRLRNIKRNYMAMNAIGIPFAKPDFMLEHRKPKPTAFLSSSDSGSDEEWIPASKKRRSQPTGKRENKLNKGEVKKIKKAEPLKKKCTGQGFDTENEKGGLEEEMAKSRVKMPDELIKPLNNFSGFSTKFVRKRMSALDRTIRHKSRLKYLLENNKIPLKMVDMLDPVVNDSNPRRKSSNKSSVPKQRYPRRNIERTNYAYIEVPSDDEYLYCEDCKREFLGSCPEHGPLNFIPESKEVDISYIGTEQYAEKTVLLGLAVKMSKIKGAGLGVWTEKAIGKNTVFGPYDGLLTKDGSVAGDAGYSWLIYKSGKPHHYVDARKKGHSNWMRFVNCACNEADQNLLAFQYQSSVYYKVLGDILPNTELLVWYGNEYAKELGLIDDGILSRNKEVVDRSINRVHGRNKITDPLVCCPTCGLLYTSLTISLHTCSSRKKDIDVFQCIDCLRMFTTQDYLCRHRRLIHGETLPHLRICNGKDLQECENLVKNKGCFTKTSSNCEVKTATFNSFKGKICSLSISESLNILKASNQTNQSGLKEKKSKEEKKQEGTHTGEKPHKCQYCDQSFSLRGSCKIHKRTHTVEKPYKCQYCDQSFSERCNCKRHEMTHTGEKPYKCQYCDKSFSQRGVCKIHEMTHTGEKPYKCQYCNQSFSQRGNFKSHEMTHTGEKPHKCQYCDKIFSVRGACKRHERTHTGEKPYTCQYCDQSFSWMVCCKRHERTHTGKSHDVMAINIE